MKQFDNRNLDVLDLRIALLVNPSISLMNTKQTTTEKSTRNCFCPTGKTKFENPTSGKKAQSNPDSCFKDKKMYRCSVCGGYHFSEKPLEHSSFYQSADRRAIRRDLHVIVKEYSTNRV